MAGPHPDRNKIKQLLGSQVGEVRLTDLSVRSEKPFVSNSTILDIVIDCNTGESIPTYFLKPAGAKASPAILYCHTHGYNYSLGRDELVNGCDALVSPYATDLANLGNAVLCMDMPCFGERSHLKESALSKAHLWHGSTLFGQMLAELTAAIDFLRVQPEVDNDRIGIMGMSMGGTQAWCMHALDERLAMSISLCSFADLECLIESDLHDRHGHYMTVPGLLDHCSTGEFAGLAAPRPQLLMVGDQDWSTPPVCFNRSRRELESSYVEKNATMNVEFLVEPGVGHRETPGMRKSALNFLQKRL